MKKVILILLTASLCCCVFENMRPAAASENYAITVSFEDEGFLDSLVPVYIAGTKDGNEEGFQDHWYYDRDRKCIGRKNDLFGADVTGNYAALYVKNFYEKYFRLKTRVSVGAKGLEGVVFGTNNIFVRHMAEGKAVYMMPDPCVELAGKNLPSGYTSPDFTDKESYELVLSVYGGRIEVLIDGVKKISAEYDEDLFSSGRVGIFTANTDAEFYGGIELCALDENGVEVPATDRVSVSGIEAQSNISVRLSQQPVMPDVKVLPENAFDKSLTYLADNPDIAAIDGEGKIHPLKEGTTVIYLMTCDGGYRAAIVVEVKKTEIELEGVALDQSVIHTRVGETVFLIASSYPEEAENDGFRWQSSDTSVALINNGTVTILKEGKCTVTVKDAEGHFTATCDIYVEAEVGGPSWIIYAAIGAAIIAGAVVAVFLLRGRKGGAANA